MIPGFFPGRRVEYPLHLTVCVLITVFLCVIRFRFDAHPVSPIGTYQAIAHCFVGGLIGAWLTDRRGKRWAGQLAILMCVVEIIAAVLGRL